jgi:hypothetical protein
MQSVANHLTLLFYLQALKSGTKTLATMVGFRIEIPAQALQKT